MYNILICDDDPSYASFLEDMIHDILDKKHVCIQKVHTSKGFLNTVDSTIDLIFMDYKIDNFNGVDLSKILRDKYLDPILVFITGEIDPIPELFDLDTFRFIYKNINQNDLESKIKNIIMHMIEKNKTKYVYVSRRGHNFRIKIDNILFISKSKHGSIIHIDNMVDSENEIPCRENLCDIYNKYREYFSSPHSSYIVNMDKVFDYSSNTLTMLDGTKLNIAKSKSISFNNDMVNFILKRK